MNATEIHKALGTDEFCRRLQELDPKRRPFLDQRDQVHTELSNCQLLFWRWIETNEDELPPALRKLRIQERQLLTNLAQVDKQLDQLWQETMTRGLDANSKGR